MKSFKYILLLLSIIFFFEVYYMHSILSFIDYPYLYLGILSLTSSLYLFNKKNDFNR